MAFNNENRPFHFIIFGATGFTGKYCIEYMVKCLQKMGLSYKWAIAGRSASKLTAAKNDVSNILGIDLNDISVIIADSSDEDSLNRMCEQCNVLINCVGPYSLYGEAVIKACIQAKTHQLDLTGEGYYKDSMLIKYNKQAEDCGVLIVNFCGVVSLIWEVGVNYLKDSIKPKVLNSIDCYLSGVLEIGLHEATYCSAVEVFANLLKWLLLRSRLEREIYMKQLPQFNYSHQKRLIPFYSEEHKGWCINTSFVDESNVIKAQQRNYMEYNERPAQIQTYLVFRSFLSIIGVFVTGLLIALFSRFNCGVNLLKKYPKLFTFGFCSSEGPTRDVIMRSSFRVTLVGKGWQNEKELSKAPDVEAVAFVDGPNAEYVTASICSIVAAITIQEEFKTNSSFLRGGVVTPGVAFRHTKIVDRLKENSLSFSFFTQD